jgi:hypothetical protein
MSLTESPAGEAANPAFSETSSAADFKFVPKYLAAKCQQLIETYHAMHGYACLPDMLWHTEVRDLVEAHTALKQIFRKSSTTRSAKRANEGFVLIATVILSLEVLASDFAGWGRRFPWAKRKAEEFRREHLPESRTRLMDLYLFAQRYINPAFINALAPPERPRSADQDRTPGRSEAPVAVDRKPVRHTPEELGWPSIGVPALNSV